MQGRGFERVCCGVTTAKHAKLCRHVGFAIPEPLQLFNPRQSPERSSSSIEYCKKQREMQPRSAFDCAVGVEDRRETRNGAERRAGFCCQRELSESFITVGCRRVDDDLSYAAQYSEGVVVVSSISGLS